MQIQVGPLEALINRELSEKCAIDNPGKRLIDNDEGTGVHAATLMGNIGAKHGWPDAFSIGVDLGIKLALIYTKSPLTSHYEEMSEVVDIEENCQRDIYEGFAKKLAGV
jgi:hypothetical protein